MNSSANNYLEKGLSDNKAYKLLNNFSKCINVKYINASTQRKRWKIIMDT